MTDPPSTGSHRTTDELIAGMADIEASPRDIGVVELLVRRPATNLREVLDQADLDQTAGVIGDNWLASGAGSVDTHLTLMNARAIRLIAGDKGRWPLAGDQIYVDLDLSQSNLPPGARISLGEAVVEITAEPHTGCRKFVNRFGAEAMKFVNSEQGRKLNLRGIYAKVVQNGTVRVGDKAQVHGR